jgi:hypothetical protein
MLLRAYLSVLIYRGEMAPNNPLPRKSERIGHLLPLLRTGRVPLVSNGLDNSSTNTRGSHQFIKIDGALLHNVGNRLKFLCRSNHASTLLAENLADEIQSCALQAGALNFSE